MKKYLFVSVLLMVITSIASVHAEQGMGGMEMMDDKFNMQMEKAEGMAMKMQKEKSDSRKIEYMNEHMESMKGMMDMMEKMSGMMQSDEGQDMAMGDCPRAGKGMMMGNKGTPEGQTQGGMMMGGMMQMMGGMMDRGEMMEKRMGMMQDMMEQMLKHMEQLEKK